MDRTAERIKWWPETRHQAVRTTTERTGSPWCTSPPADPVSTPPSGTTRGWRLRPEVSASSGPPLGTRRSSSVFRRYRHSKSQRLPKTESKLQKSPSPQLRNLLQTYLLPLCLSTLNVTTLMLIFLGVNCGKSTFVRNVELRPKIRNPCSHRTLPQAGQVKIYPINTSVLWNITRWTFLMQMQTFKIVAFNPVYVMLTIRHFRLPPPAHVLYISPTSFITCISLCVYVETWLDKLWPPITS